MAGGPQLGTAYVQILPSARGLGSSISAELNKEAGSAGEKSGATLAAGIGRKLAAGVAALGIGATIGKALSEGGKLQQSYLGGLDTLYGKAADKAREFADAAAAAGISQNDYAEQAVSFGAALKQAYGGDTTKAVNAANTAIMDMTDNAAKMGTPLESIQMAYQGFAKDNYTMLDNLKLGYGGTKTEMERLLEDAQKISGQKYDISNLGDVYDAIHVIQGDLGLTGVAAEEASETLEGSFNAMKASAMNLLGNLALGQNVGPSMQAFATSLSTYLFKNLMPMLKTIFMNLPAAISAFMRAGLPSFMSGVSAMVSEVMNYLGSHREQLLATMNRMANVAAKYLQANIPKFMAVALKIGTKIAAGFVKSLPSILRAIATIVKAVGKGLLTGLGNAATSALRSVRSRINNVWSRIKETLLKPVRSAQAAIKGVIDRIKGFFSFSVPTPHIPLPHFSVKPAGWKVGDLLKGKIPSLGVSWYAKGGIVDDATLIGAGEAGAEGIIPLDPFWRRMDAMADSINTSSSNPGVVQIYLDGAKIAESTVNYVNGQTIRYGTSPLLT